MHRAVVLGTGSCLPRRVLTNDDLEQMVDTSDEWITARTGIRTRRIAGKGEQNYQLATQAAEKALASAGVRAEEIDLVAVATLTPHMMMPSCACFVQAEIGAKKAFAFDLNAACSGFLYGLDMAGKYIAARPEMKVLLIGSETLSARMNWQDRNTCILFGDGAGACVLTGAEQRGIVDCNLFSDGSLWKLLYMDSPASRNPDLLIEERNGCFMQMTGRDVFKYAVRAMENAVLDLLNRQQIAINDISLIIPHQANIRILSKLTERLGADQEKVFINVDKYGNTSAASIPIALDEANRQNRLEQGDLVLFCSFGGGFTWGSMLMRW
ncbi:MAG: beta-ketoacyl-ACP synthase III [Candidatus Electrothrix sp. GW3-4]|uniref:beta-ketoacyl-ACP synthase III n=1 Tax=Candidatus Electrothrix sp. GW3-4 TaxID=3126740 RepID=UPI0030CDE699